MPPAGNALQQTIQKFYNIARMPGVVGAIDCTHIQILRPSVENSEVFRCRKGYFSLNVQAVCGPDLCFHNVVARWPGSAHDSRIFQNSRLCAELEAELNPSYHLLGDSGYGLKTYLLTPVPSPSDAHEKAYNYSHAATRNTVERAFGVLVKFGYIGKTKLETTQEIIIPAFVLHNIALQTRLILPGDVELEDSPNNHALQDVGIPVQGRGNIARRVKRQQIIKGLLLNYDSRLC